MGISKNSYYFTTDSNSRLLAKYDKLKDSVVKIIEKNSKYGIRRIQADLSQKFNIDVGRDSLGKLLILWGLDLRRNIKRHKPNMIQKILEMIADKTNILIRSKINAPYQAISSDMTEIHYAKGKLFLCVHKDVFGQMIYGYSISLKPNLELVFKSLNMAIDKIKKKIGIIPKTLIFHQDRGSVYTSYSYVNKILSMAKLSFSAPGTPTDNAGQESFFGRFKNEWSDEILLINDQKDAILFIKNKIKYYNYERIHTTIGYQSPARFTSLFLNGIRNQFNKSRT